MSSPSSLPEFSEEYLKTDHGSRVLAASIVMLVVTTLLFPLRLYARSLTVVRWQWDDLLLFPAYFFVLGTIIVIICEVVVAGLGQHTIVVTMQDPYKITQYLQLLYAMIWLYQLANLFSRLSVVVLYLHILKDKWARFAAWATLGYLIVLCLATVIAEQLQCSPTQFFWDKTIEGGTCVDQIKWYQITNYPNIVGDLAIAALPVRTIWTIKASTSRKAGIACVCLLGSIGLISCCVRASVFYKEADTIMNDPTFADEAFSWTAVECGMYFSAACLVGMRPLLNKIRQMRKGDQQGMTTGLGHSRGPSFPIAYSRQGYYENMYDGNDLESGSRRHAEMDDDEIALAKYPHGGKIRIDTEVDVRKPPQVMRQASKFGNAALGYTVKVFTRSTPHQK